MREICTSGSVRDGDGNAPIYSAVDALELGEGTVEDRLIGERGKRSEERQAAERGLELVQEQSSEKLGKHLHREEEAWPAGDPARAIAGQAAAGDQTMNVRMVAPTPTIP
jgi:hypothetical protein